MRISIEKKHSDAIVPEKCGEGIVGVNLFAYIRNEKYRGSGITINPGKSYQFSTGVSVAVPEGCVGLVFPDAKMSGTRQLHLIDGAHIISPADKDKELIIALENGGKASQTVQQGACIARLFVVAAPEVDLD